MNKKWNELSYEQLESELLNMRMKIAELESSIPIFLPNGESNIDRRSQIEKMDTLTKQALLLTEYMKTRLKEDKK